MTPAGLFSRYNPDLGAVIEQNGMTAGRLAMNAHIPTLAHIAEFYSPSDGVRASSAAPIAWLKIQLDNLDAILGCNVFTDQARADAARLIYAKYKDMNLASLLQFFTRYKMGEYVEKVEHVGGIQKVMTALRLYHITMMDDARRIEREQRENAEYKKRLEWEKNAISYDEYIKNKTK